MDIRTVTAAVERQETITKDNVPVKINAVMWYRVIDPKKAMPEVRSVDNAVIQVALKPAHDALAPPAARRS